MPSREQIRALIAMVEQAKYVEAVQEFHAEDATTKERFHYDPAQRHRFI
jgi:hypothetical protein